MSTEFTSPQNQTMHFDLDAHLTPEFDAYISNLESRIRAEGILDDEDIKDLSQNELIFDRSYLSELNALVRGIKARWLKGDSNDSYWPDDFLIIGGSGCGDYYFISSTATFAGVRIYEHEIGAVSQVAVDLDGYYQFILDDIRQDK